MTADAKLEREMGRLYAAVRNRHITAREFADLATLAGHLHNARLGGRRVRNPLVTVDGYQEPLADLNDGGVLFSKIADLIDGGEPS